jgi:hypothetical protein
MGLEGDSAAKKKRKTQPDKGRARGRHTEEDPCKFTRVAVIRRERQRRLGNEQTLGISRDCTTVTPRRPACNILLHLPLCCGRRSRIGGGGGLVLVKAEVLRVVALDGPREIRKGS